MLFSVALVAALRGFEESFPIIKNEKHHRAISRLTPLQPQQPAKGHVFSALRFDKLLLNGRFA